MYTNKNSPTHTLIPQQEHHDIQRRIIRYNRCRHICPHPTRTRLPRARLSRSPRNHTRQKRYTPRTRKRNQNLLRQPPPKQNIHSRLHMLRQNHSRTQSRTGNHQHPHSPNHQLPKSNPTHIRPYIQLRSRTPTNKTHSPINTPPPFVHIRVIRGQKKTSPHHTPTIRAHSCHSWTKKIPTPHHLHTTPHTISTPHPHHSCTFVSFVDKKKIPTHPIRVIRGPQSPKKKKKKFL